METLKPRKRNYVREVISDIEMKPEEVHKMSPLERRVWVEMHDDYSDTYDHDIKRMIKKNRSCIGTLSDRKQKGKTVVEWGY